MRRHHLIGTGVVVIVVWLAATHPVSTEQPPPNAGDAVVFVGAGDIANCDMLGGARATAALLDGIAGTVFTNNGTNFYLTWTTVAAG